MNNSKLPRRQRSWWKRPSTWLVGLILPLCAILGGFWARELSAKRQAQQLLSELRLKGKPVDNASMELKFVSTTSSENTLAWSEAAYAASGWASTMGQDLPHFGMSSTPASAFIDGAWPEAERVGEFLTHLQPLLQRLHEAADKTSGPVWQPIHFDGFYTLLGSIQERRSLSRLLVLDFDYAVFVKDRERALRNLKTARAAITAYQWDAFLVAELVNLAQTGLMYASIGKSLQSDMWTASDLNELKRLVGPPIDVASRWPKLYEFELAASLATINSTADLGSDFGQLNMVVSRMAKLPSSQLRFLDDMQRIGALGQNDLEQLLKSTANLDRPENRGLIASMLATGVRQFARAYVNAEESRRTLLTAIALKQYKLSQGSYPAKLDQLLEESKMDVTRAELEGIDHSPLGYQLDGQIAFLWNTRPANNDLGKITAELPEFNSETGYSKDHYGTLITLR
jgi:hypothetical protein